jgi:hypothetical protein
MTAEQTGDAAAGFHTNTAPSSTDISVTVKPFELHTEMTVDTFFSTWITQMEATEGYNFISKQNSTLDGAPIIKLVYSIKKNSLMTKGISIFMVNQKTGWIITCKSPQESFASFEPAFKYIYTSFRPIDGVELTDLPVIRSFNASTQAIENGEHATLIWDVSGATRVVIHPIGEGVELAGTMTVSPAVTTTYILNASNKNGTKTHTIEIQVKPDSDFIVGYDPVTGRNQDIAFTWEQLCLASEYQVQIAKDPGFTIIVFDSGVYEPTSVTSPGMLYLAGGVLMPGTTYYIRARVRGTVTGQSLRGPWSDFGSFIVGQGAPVSTPYQGIQLLQPKNNCSGCSIGPLSFSWSPLKETDYYRFILAKDPGLTDVIVIAETNKPSYEYYGTLDYQTIYYWQVMALEPAPSEPSAIFVFTTKAESVPEIVTPEPLPEQAVPLWAWIVIGLGSLLIISVLILIVRVR